MLTLVHKWDALRVIEKSMKQSTTIKYAKQNRIVLIFLSIIVLNML